MQKDYDWNWNPCFVAIISSLILMIILFHKSTINHNNQIALGSDAAGYQAICFGNFFTAY